MRPHRYNLFMQANRSSLPSADRIGVLIASVLLTFALTRLIQSPRLTLTLSLPGFYYALPLTLGTFMTLLAAALTAAGMDWLIRNHPTLEKKTTFEHLMLPTITTYVIGALLALLPDGRSWWVGFAFGSVLLVTVFMAEYITVEPSHRLMRWHARDSRRWLMPSSSSLPPRFGFQARACSCWFRRFFCLQD